MAINVQANQLTDNVSRLRNARKQMLEYKSSVSANWQGKEVGYIQSAIDGVIADIDAAMRSLESLGSDIKSTAAQIKREEDAAAAAAARAATARQQRIADAQSECDKAQQHLDSLVDKLQKLQKKLKKASFFDKARYTLEIKDLERELESAKEKYEDAQNALRAAKR